LILRDELDTKVVLYFIIKFRLVFQNLKSSPKIEFKKYELKPQIEVYYEMWEVAKFINLFYFNHFLIIFNFIIILHLSQIALIIIFIIIIYFINC